MNARALVFAFTVLALISAHALPSFAQTPTEEPTKRPYVFPTPIFIPTYPNDTPPPPPTRTATPTARASVPATETRLDTAEQTYTVQPGDSLWIIAQKVYGNGAKYPLIAQANDITTTTPLRTGMILKIPNTPGLATLTLTPTHTPTTLTLSALALPTPVPVTTSPTPTPTPTRAPVLPASLAEGATLGLQILAALCAFAALVSAALAYLTYARARRLQRVEGKPPLRLR